MIFRCRHYSPTEIPWRTDLISSVHIPQVSTLSSSKIMGAFAEVMGINDAREEIKQQKQEIEEQRKVIDRRLEAFTHFKEYHGAALHGGEKEYEYQCIELT